MLQANRLELLGHLTLGGGHEELSLVQKVTVSVDLKRARGLIPMALKYLMARREVIKRLLVGS